MRFFQSTKVLVQMCLKNRRNEELFDSGYVMDSLRLKAKRSVVFHTEEDISMGVLQGEGKGSTV